MLLIPREHRDTMLDAEPDLLGELIADAQLLARAVEAGLGADGSFVAVNNSVSQSVPHLHVHVVPRRRKDGLRGFFWPRNPYRDDAHADEVQEALRAAVATLSANGGTRAGTAKRKRDGHAIGADERRTMAVEQALQEFRETEIGRELSRCKTTSC